MSRRNSPGLAHQEEKLSEAECEEFAEAFVDKILDPSTPWIRMCLLAGLENPELSRELARRMGLPTDSFNTPWAQGLKDALERMDREKLVGLVKSEFLKDPLTKEQAHTLLTVDLGALMRNALQEGTRKFAAKRGRKPKAGRRDYVQIARWGDKLYPVCLRVLSELKSGTHRSVREHLELSKQDFPEAVTFLLHNLARFESTLKDKRLRKRAIRIESLARLLADGMAGADYGLTSRTSIERAREGRRMTARVRA